MDPLFPLLGQAVNERKDRAPLFLIYSAIDTAGLSFPTHFPGFFFNNWALFINSHYYLKTWEEEGLLNVDQRVSNVANVLADKVNKYMVTLLLLLYPNPSC